jgi:hypothetical protein
MKLIFKQTLTTICLCSLMALSYGKENKTAETISPIALPQPSANPIKPPLQQSAGKLQLPVAKLITSDKMVLLNDVLAEHPEGVVRMSLASKAIIKVLTDLDKEDKSTNNPTIITAQIISVINPVRQFIDVIYDYGTIIRPLILESIFGIKIDSLSEAQTVSLQYQDKCLLLGFLNAKNNRNTFFEDRVKTKDELKKICIEFLQFFKDLNLSLSDKVHKAYRELIETLKKAP